MTKETTNDECPNDENTLRRQFVIQISSFLRAWAISIAVGVIRHFPNPFTLV